MPAKKEEITVEDLQKEVVALKKEVASLKRELGKAKSSGGEDPRVDKLIKALLLSTTNFAESQKILKSL